MHDNTSSKAENRELKTWYELVKSGRIKLPRFQRAEAWDKNRVTSFLNTIVTNLPVGITLVLHVGDKEKFISRYIETAERDNTEKMVSEHLLDGQQRITALWRSMNDNYPYESYFVYIPCYDKSLDCDDQEIKVICKSRYYKGNERYPLWLNDPEKCFENGLVPLALFKPEDIGNSLNEWVKTATIKKLKNNDLKDSLGHLEPLEYMEYSDSIKKHISDLRDAIKHYNLPYLSLPPSTEKDVALQVFINMNTNSKPLSQFDIIVAEAEQQTGQSLHDLIKRLNKNYSNVSRYFELEELTLSTTALLQGKVPNKNGIFSINLQKMIDDWDILEKCLKAMADFLELNGVYDKQRLPTNAVLGVIAACFAVMPEKGDAKGYCEHLLKKYLWSAFFTDRYENSAPPRAHVDCMALRNIIQKAQSLDDGDSLEFNVPIFDRKLYPLPDIDELISVGWPKRSNIRARAILAISTLLGAHDFADGQKISPTNIEKRHYHHIFPLSLLEEANIQDYNLALNCSLITDSTNQSIGRKDPFEYLVDRYKWAGEDVVRDRLYSHLVPIDELKTGSYQGLDENEKEKKVKADFESFILKRAELVRKAAEKLINGENISSYSIYTEERIDKKALIMDLITTKENYEVEYKASLRKCVKDQIPAETLEHSVFKNIAGFMNANGGSLLIGVEDKTKEILGLDKDYSTFSKEDKSDAFLLHIDNLLENTLGSSVMNNFRAEIIDIDGKDVALLTVKTKSNKPVWLTNKKKNTKEFWVRRSASASELKDEEANEYISAHWKTISK